jgi:hypothetical protein
MFKEKSEKEIWKQLKKRSLEDIESIKAIEDFFIKKRGYVFQMPKPKSPVILLLSGGMDSIVLWDILVSKYQLNVYPVFVTEKRGIFRYLDNQYRSAEYFERFYKKKFKSLFHPKIVVYIGDFLRDKILKFFLKNPIEILNNVYEDGNICVQNYSTTNLLASAALDYIQLLKFQKNIEVKTIFIGNLVSDGEIVQNQTLTSLRSIMFNLCNISGDYDKQFTSLFLEKELGYFLEKDSVIKWAQKESIPVTKTWTCWDRNGILPCGSCIACEYRQNAMAQSGLKDVVYMNFIKDLLLTVSNKMSKLRRRLVS